MSFDPFNPEEGIWPDIPENLYRMTDAVNISSLKHTDTSMAHYHAAVTEPQPKPTEAQIIGTLTHALILQQRQLFVVPPDDAPKRPTKSQMAAKKPNPDAIPAINWWRAFEAKHPGKEILFKDEAKHLFGMRDAVMDHPIASEIMLRTSKFEVAAFKRHSSGLMMKGRADAICVDDRQFTTIPDLKTCQIGGAAEWNFTKSVFDYGYDRQAAYYLDLFGATYFVFIAVEKEPPYAVAVHDLETEDIARARRKNDAALHRVAECKKTGIWPAYENRITRLVAPKWVRDLG